MNSDNGDHGKNEVQVGAITEYVLNRMAQRSPDKMQPYTVDKIVQEYEGQYGDVCVFLGHYKDEMQAYYVMLIEIGDKVYGLAAENESLMCQQLQLIRLCAQAFGGDQIGTEYPITIDVKAIAEQYAKSHPQKEE